MSVAGAFEEAPASFVGTLTSVLRHRRLILRVSLLSAILVAVGILSKDRTFSTRASLMPQARRQVQGLSGLAAQFGLAVPVSDGAQSPAFYVDLLGSRQLLGDVVMTRFRVGNASRDTLLAHYLGAVGADSAETRERGFLEIRNLLSVSSNSKTGVITLTVTTRDAILSADIAARLLVLLDEFNQERRRSQATAERLFTERRLEEVRRELREAEARQLQFLEKNRNFSGSAELRFEQDRLEREVVMRQQVYTSLAQAHEQARIEEVRDTPVISVVELPTVAALPDGRGLVRYTAIAFVLVACAAAAVVVGRELVIPSTRGGDEVGTFMAEWRLALDDLRNPLRSLFRQW